MYCRKCGSEIKDGENKCPNCGYNIQNTKVFGEENIMAEEKNKNRISVWCLLSIISLLSGCFCFYKGIDKMINYNSGEFYPYETVNAYVGGDVYNYIINGAYANAFFVLTAMFILSSIGLVCVHYLSRKNE